MRDQDAHTIALRLEDTAINAGIAHLIVRQTGHEQELRASIFVGKASIGRLKAAVVGATTSALGPLERSPVTVGVARVGLPIPTKAVRHIQGVDTFDRSALVPI
jgi:hypothetical protein